ncbi:MAG: FecR family protein [Bacteroidales bacterium]|nr:FecR family protein [Bacteroidales bacterium]
MSDKKNDILYTTLLLKHFEGLANYDENEEIKEWISSDESNQKIYNEYKYIWDNAENPACFKEYDSLKALNELQNKYKGTVKNKNTKKISLYKYLIRIAAVFILLFGIYFFFVKSEKAEIIAEEAIIKNRDLPDGSCYYLNKNSSLLFNEKFKKREVYLEGEAFFDVTHKNNSDFIIHTSTSKITVLGTSFNVRAYPGDSVVVITVVEGKVQLESVSNQKRDIVIHANQKGIFYVNNNVIKSTELSNYDLNDLAWKTQRLIYVNSSMPYVMQTLEKHYNVNIVPVNEKIFNCKLTSEFNNQTIEEVFEVLRLTLQISFEFKGNTYFIYGEGC